ncbi:MAG: serine/threonine protein kinase [Chloroflexi bacterium]|nr:serine/threonine protein kinase [Chloroflexota bacterium]
MVTAAVHSSQSLANLTPGASFGKYTLLEQIGVGGQGVVWSALNQNRDRIYAIKFNEIPETEEAQADDLRDEHQLEKLVKLRHAHILPVYEYGFHENLRFTISPYLPGGTLTQKIRSQPLSMNEALKLGMEIASALDYLHSQGVIHRDLKSSNILLDTKGRSHLADFGLARVLSTSTLAFHTGHGTPPYAPPEQNSLKAITLKSDIFSFGILLFEMFTGQLPWNGKKQLGMEQLYAKAVLPDPCEINPNLPPRMADVLRRVTSVNPDLRPRSAEEVMKAIYFILEIPYAPLQTDERLDDPAEIKTNVEDLLVQALAQWEATEGMYNMGLTRFAMVDMGVHASRLDRYNSFLLSQALIFGYNDDRWWAAVSDPGERLAISSLLLKRNNEAIAARIADHLISDMEIRSFTSGVPANILASLLDMSLKTGNLFLQRQLLQGIRELTRPAHRWSDHPLQLSASQVKALGSLALEDNEAGDAAAELIGHLRATPAVQIITEHHNEDRKMNALFLIQQTARNLPALVHRRIRFKLRLEWAIQHLIQQPASLMGAYALALLGSSLGVGIQVYTTYNWPDFFDVLRITTSLEQGVIIGAVFALGILAPRMFVERFQGSRAMARVGLGTITGTVGINLALLVFHIVFVKTPPQGVLITAGSMLIALALAVGGLARSYRIKVLLTSAAVFAAILGTWWLHINFAASNLELTPLFIYPYDWSLTRVTITAFGVSLPVGLLGNLVNLSIRGK